jgi:hypothetical protein
MFCPRCGQERISQETSFCSRCGFLLTAVHDLLLTDGVASSDTGISRESPRWRGVKQGIFLIMLMIVLAPVLGLIFRFGFNMIPWPMGVLIFLLGGGGILRIAYALMFEPKHAELPELEVSSRRAGIAGRQPSREIAEGDVNYIPPELIRREQTNSLESPPSVTENTTKLLEKEPD